jgi:hypothetical protein
MTPEHLNAGDRDSPLRLSHFGDLANLGVVEY